LDNLKKLGMKTIFTFSKKNFSKGFLPTLLILLFSTWAFSQNLHVVDVRNNQFDPAELVINTGDTVEWRNVQGYHNVNGMQSVYASNPQSFGNDAGENWIFRHVFTVPGSYDYQCDPHVGLGMVGNIVVQESNLDEEFMLTVVFSGMNPHIGQDFWLAVIDKNSGMEVGRVHTAAEADFSVEIAGIESGSSYKVDFWADHNGNGMYDAPPTDHAWRLELDDVEGDATLMFAHNTDFTDIMWRNLLTLEFSGMNPHIGQDFWLAVVDKNSEIEVGRIYATAEIDFSLQVAGIVPGSSYNVDFWADHNGNGMYDAPPTDHAWRLELDNVEGDTTLMFAHNTNFTDIVWRNKLTVEFSGMNPHIGQMFALYVVNAGDGAIQDSVIVEEITEADFTVDSYIILPGNSYFINFFADFNDNGIYDAPPVDHAWQLMLENVAGDTTLTFMHNTEFTDIFPVTSVRLTDQELFKVYPNPANDKVWIEPANVSPENYRVSVFNISGKLSDIKTRTWNNRIELDINHLQKGIYFIELKSASDKKTIKLIKN
jgi:plastocyanin